MFHRFALDTSGAKLNLTTKDYASWVQGGLVNQRKQP
eukprot:UN16338